MISLFYRDVILILIIAGRDLNGLLVAFNFVLVRLLLAGLGGSQFVLLLPRIPWLFIAPKAFCNEIQAKSLDSPAVLYIMHSTDIWQHPAIRWLPSTWW